MSRRNAGEDGAYLVLYALLATTFFVIAALVLDITALRQDRSSSRLAADAAATAAAVHLNGTPAGRVQACRQAWNYFLANRPNTSPTLVTPSCTQASGGVFNAVCDPTTAQSDQGRSDDFTVTIVNPVPNGHALMQAESPGGDTDQPANAAHDGADPCERIGVQVRRTRDLSFAGVAGLRSSSTDVHSVARLATSPAGRFTSIVTLETDPSRCPSITTEASATVHAVAPNPSSPEPLAVDTSSCSGASVAISGDVRAELPGPAPGFARVSAVSQTGTLAYGSIRAGSLQTGRAPVTNRYNCSTANGCPNAATTPPFIDILRSQLSSGPPAAVGLPEGAYTPITAPLCSSSLLSPLSPLGPLQIAKGNYYIDCPTFTVDADTTIAAGSNVVFTGNVVVQDQRCLTIGRASVLAGCGAESVTQQPSVVVMQSGDIRAGNQSQLHLNNTMVFVRTGRMNFAGPSGTLAWSAPNTGVGSGCPTSNPRGCNFDDLMLWSDAGTADYFLKAGTEMSFDGVLYVPTARVTFEASTQGRWQLFAQRVLARGATVRAQAQPVPGRAVEDLTRRARLIR